MDGKEPLCDFCCSTTVKWRYACDNFDVPEYSFRSKGDWACCDVCSELIEKNDLQGLKERSVSIMNIPSFAMEHLRGFVKILHARFFEHKRGGREAIDPNFKAEQTVEWADRNDRNDLC